MVSQTLYTYMPGLSFTTTFAKLTGGGALIVLDNGPWRWHRRGIIDSIFMALITTSWERKGQYRCYPETLQNTYRVTSLDVGSLGDPYLHNHTGAEHFKRGWNLSTHMVRGWGGVIPLVYPVRG